MLVIQEFGMIDVGMFDMRSGPLGDRQELLDARPRASPFEPGQSLPQGFGDDAGHRLAGGARDLLRESMGLRILDVKAHPVLSSNSTSYLPFYIAFRPSSTLRTVIFAVRERPVQGTRGIYRVNLRHGVSRIKSGERFTLGIIFHDAA
jgi:hypothetical protein